MAVHLDAATVCFCDSLGERQSEPGALVFLAGRRIQLLELDEEFVHRFGGDANSRVFDLQPEVVVVLGESAYDDSATLGSELDSVGKVVVENLLHASRVDEHG